VFNEFDNEFGDVGFNVNPARPTLAACGYDPYCYISTAKLAPSPYTTQALIQAKLGGLIKLIEACDDSQPPIGDLKDDALLTFQNIVQNVTTEINGYLSSVYPIPLSQTGTVAVLKITGVSDDGLGVVTDLEVIQAGNYFVAPDVDQFPVYLRHIDNFANEAYFGQFWYRCQLGSGLELTVAYADTPFSDENGSTVNAKAITGVPVIVAGGTKYNVGDLLVLVGGQSFVPAKIREAALSLICYDLYQRRLAPDEKNLFAVNNKIWRGTNDEDGLLKKIGAEDYPLDGTYKRFFSVGAVWGQRSVLFPASSL
jgi:hypothetical protein